MLLAGLTCSCLLAEPEIKYSKSTTPTGEVLDISTAVLPFGEVIFEVNPEGSNKRQRLFLKELNSERVLISDELKWIDAPDGIYSAAAAGESFSILVISGFGTNEVWRYHKTASGCIPDGIGSIGSHGFFAAVAKGNWKLTTPDEVQQEYEKGGYLTFTITHQALIEGGPQMLVLKDGKPFHPYGYNLPGLENIPEEPIPKDSRKGKDLIMIQSQEEVKLRKQETTKTLAPQKPTDANAPLAEPETLLSQKASKSDLAKAAEPPVTSSPPFSNAWWFLLVGLMAFAGWLIVRRNSRKQ